MVSLASRWSRAVMVSLCAALLVGAFAGLGCSPKHEIEGSGTSAEPPGGEGEPTVPRDDTAGAEPPAQTANGGGEARIAEFPWPPPEPTLRYRVRRDLLIRSDSETLGSAFDRLTGTLERAGIDQWSAYGAGRKGFAVVGRLEHIRDDGTPEQPRWTLESGQAKFSLGEYLLRLFVASPGRYRVIVFLVRPPVPYSYSPAPTPGQLDTLLLHGATALPDTLRGVPARLANVEALIYEFYRPTEHRPPSFVRRTESPLTAIGHLAGAGIWSRQELAP